MSVVLALHPYHGLLSFLPSLPKLSSVPSLSVPSLKLQRLRNPSPDMRPEPLPSDDIVEFSSLHTLLLTLFFSD